MKKPVALTCSTEYTSSVHSIEWIVNGRQIWSDSHLLTESGQIISNLLFVPQIDDSIVECKIKGNKVRSANVFFSVINDPQPVKLQKAEKSETNKILWIPFDINKLNINRLDGSGEETAVTYRRDIYQFMQDKPLQTTNNVKHLRKIQKLHNKKSDSFLEELEPISSPIVSDYYSSSSKPTANMVKLMLCFVFYSFS